MFTAIGKMIVLVAIVAFFLSGCNLFVDFMNISRGAQSAIHQIYSGIVLIGSIFSFSTAFILSALHSIHDAIVSKKE